jgi:GT2 family glycosyltransferase
VVVATYQRRDLLARCLEGLDAQVLDDGAFEVIVVDDGSTDGTGALLEAWASRGPDRHAVLLEHNVGAAAARNAGVARASAPIVAITDDDCVPSPRWLAHGLAAMAAPDVAVVQGATHPDPDVPLGSWPRTQQIEELTWLFETCNIFYRRDALLAAGGFDEGLRWFGEDTTAGWRVLRAGGRATFAADAEVVHAVVHPGFTAFIEHARHYRSWPALVARCPELRDAALWHRWFLRRRSAELLAMVAGTATAMVAVAARRPALAATGLLLAAPYLRRRLPRRLDPDAWVDAGRSAAFDLAVEAALIEGSIRHRTVVV